MATPASTTASAWGIVAWRPRADPEAMAARNMSPVEIWGIPRAWHTNCACVAGETRSVSDPTGSRQVRYPGTELCTLTAT